MLISKDEVQKAAQEESEEVPELLIKSSAFSTISITVASPYPAEATERCPFPISTDTPGLYPCSFLALRNMGNKSM